MQFKHKFIYFCAGCAFVVMGQVLLSVVVPQVTAQGEKETVKQSLFDIVQGKKETVEFDTVKVRSLQVVDDAGKVRVQLEVTKRKSVKPVDDVIQVFNGDGVPVYLVGVSTDGASMFVNDKNAKGRVHVIASPDGGSVNVIGDKGGASIGVDKNGGSVNVIGDKGGASIGVDKNGGRTICTDSEGSVHIGGGSAYFRGNDGKACVGIIVDEHGGGAVFYSNDGELCAVIGVNEYGGRAGFYGNDGEPRAGIGVNEYGHGAVSTWDKHGYRQR